MKIQTSTDVLIDTYNPTSNMGSTYGFSVMKEPIGNDSYKITLVATCSGMFCSPKPDEVRKSFYYYLNTGKDVLEGIDGLMSIH